MSRKKREIKKANIEDGRKYLNELLEKKLLNEICVINKETDKTEDIVSSYKEKEFYKENIPSKFINQSGRLWLLVGESDNIKTALTAGQSLDIVEEIEKNINAIFAVNEKKNKKTEFYKKMKDEYEKLYFYEVKINKFLEFAYGEIGELTFVAQVLVDMSKEYLAEATIAFYTGAIYWDFYNSGMDGRSYCYILDNNKFLI